MLKSSEYDDNVFTAFHEIGHAWAHHQVGRSFRYVTLRPRQPGLVGICRPWPQKRVDIGEVMQIAAAGPIAEAMYSMRCQRAEDCEFPSFLSDAITLGGHDDAEQARGLLNLPMGVDLTRSQLEADWPAIERLADMLTDRGTLSGREVFRVFGPCPSGYARWPPRRSSAQDTSEAGRGIRVDSGATAPRWSINEPRSAS